MKSDKPAKRVLVLGNMSRDIVRQTIAQLEPALAPLARLEQRDLESPAPLTAGAADLAIVVGGDGSILRAARDLAPAGVPCLGVNIGRLGFLAAFTVTEMIAAWPQILAAGGRRVERLMLAVEVVKRRGERSHFTALNEVVIGHGPSHRMTCVRLEINGETVAEYNGDGLIVATPTGSTAYNLAAGGPIVESHIDALVITPICPHTLTHRAIVIDTASRILLRPCGSRHEASCIIDGQANVAVVEGDLVHVALSPHRFTLLENEKRSPFETLRTKLHWSDLPRYSG